MRGGPAGGGRAEAGLAGAAQGPSAPHRGQAGEPFGMGAAGPPPTAPQCPCIVDRRLDAHTGREELVLVAENSFRVFGSLIRS